jgi:Carboxypeptidase regulatory-like domain
MLDIYARNCTESLSARPARNASRWRCWIAFGCSAVLVLMCATQARCEVTVAADPNSFPHAAQRARITVLFDGSPMAGASVAVRKFGDSGAVVSDAVVTLSTDSKGQTALPVLPDGYYQISAWSTRYPGMGAGFAVCVGPCPKPLSVVDLNVVNLNGDVEPVDEATTAVSEFRAEIGPLQYPSRAQLIAWAENQPIVRTLREFRGTVTDPIGAPVPEAWICVVRQGKQGDKEIALFRTDHRGAFAAKLPEGRYTVLVAAGGFQDRAMPIAVLPTGDSSAFQVALKIAPAL